MVNVNAIATQGDSPLLDPDAPIFPVGGNPVLAQIEQSLLINGTDGADTLVGTDGDDAIFAGAGDDTIIGTLGTDFINGGAGFDTVDFSNLEQPVILQPSAFFDPNSDVQLFNIESVIGAVRERNAIISTDLPVFGDGINVNLANNSFSSGPIPVPNPGLTRELRLGNIDLTITNFDRIVGSAGADTIIGNEEENVLAGGDSNDIIAGADGDDNLFGNAGNDSLSGGNGDDRLAGGDGDDTIRGGSGADEIFGGAGRNRIIAGRGADTIRGGSDHDIIRGNAGADSIFGNDGRDYIFGGAGSDIIRGDEGDDRIRGGSGDDLIIGGTGNDLVAGGRGSDTFLFETNHGTDTIVDFTVGQDVIGFIERDITFGALDITQSGSSAVLTNGFTTEVLAVLENVNASDLTAASFVTLPPVV